MIAYMKIKRLTALMENGQEVRRIQELSQAIVFIVLKEGDKCYFETICSQQDDLKCKTDRKSHLSIP